MTTPITAEPSVGSGGAHDAGRDLASAGTAGIIAGLLVGGLGGRLVMRVSAIAADSTGMLTQGGNRVGDITLGGTIELIVFGGGLSGLVGGIVLFVLGPWLPRGLLARAAAFGLILPVMLGSTIIAAENVDFLLLDPPSLNITMFLVLFFAYGVASVLIEQRLLRILSDSGENDGDTTLTSVLHGAAVSFIAFLLLADAMLGQAIFIAALGFFTIVRLRGLGRLPGSRLGRRAAPLGQLAIALASLAGGISLIGEIRQIL